MASWYIGGNRGYLDKPGLLTVGTTSAGTDFEMRIDTGQGSTKKDVELALELFSQFILSNGIQSGTPGGFLPPL